jgi:hypothetical protein
MMTKKNVKRWQFKGRAYTVVQCGVHCLMDHIHGFMRPSAAMVDDFEKKRKNTNKTQLLPSFLTVDQRKKAIKSQDLPGTL